MALVRVYCGISSAADPGYAGVATRLTVAVVDDSGRLLEYCEIHDDPAGYAVITALLAERFGGSAVIMLAVDSEEHLVVSLLAAAGRSIAYTDDETADDFATRFGAGEDDLEEAIADRRAVGLARALHAGALSAAVTPAPRELVALKPIIAAHSALAVGRQAAAMALREVLRELYPAALRAYPDPAEPIALAMLDALPEPGLLGAASGKSRDAAVTVAARLVADGVCDNETALDAVTALRTAINETPKRNGAAKQMNTAVADAVRASVAAVRSADAAVTILIHALAERISPASAPVVTTAAPRRRVPTAITTPAIPRPVSPPPMAPAPIAPPPVVPAPPTPVLVPAAAAERPAWAQSTPQPLPPGFEPTPVTGTPLVPRQPVAPQLIPAQRTPEPLETPFVPVLTTAAINSERAARGLGPTPPLIPPAPTPPPTTYAAPATYAEPGSRANWPLVNEHEDELRPNRITPPWQSDDLVLPPSLRVVEPSARLAPEATAVPLRLVDDSALTSRIPKPRVAERSLPPQDDDTDLLIFSSVSSAWFTGPDDTESTWNSAMDTGWRAAEAASLRPSSNGDTRAGLPQRVPTANLVPGSPTLPDRPLRIVRDAGEIAAHTSSYFRGSRRGNQEAGSFAVGGRPGRESATGWDFSREHDVREYYDERQADYRHQGAANYR